MPCFFFTAAAPGDARKRSSAAAAPGCRAAVVIVPANVNPGWSSRRQRADKGHAGNMDKLAHLLESDLHLTACDHRRHRLA